MKCVRCGEDFRVDEASSNYNSYDKMGGVYMRLA